MHAREMPRLRHVFLDNLFGNINHHELNATKCSKGCGPEIGRGVVAPGLPVLLSLLSLSKNDVSSISRLWIRE